MKKSGKISRRNLLQGAGAVAAAGALGAAQALAADQLPASALPGSGGKPRALALIGDRYHNQNEIRIAINRVFRELGISIDYTTNYYDLSAELLKPYQLFVCYRDNMIWPGGYLQTGTAGAAGRGGGGSPGEDPGVFPREKEEYWISEEQGMAVKDFVAAGNSFYSYHNNAFVSRSSKNYREVQGGCALNHPPLRPFKVKIVNKNHPITQGVEDFMVTDEQHYLVYDKDPNNILLQSENVDGLTYIPDLTDPNHPDAPTRDMGTGTVSGWAHEYGKGRVVFTAMGHTNAAMWEPNYFKLQKNAVRWLLRMS
jgi:type 1 glutamine amidotransferase